METRPRTRSLRDWLFGGSVRPGDSRAFQQERVATFLKLLALLIGSFLLIDVAGAVNDRGLGALGERSLLLHFALAAGLFAAWAYARQGARPAAIVTILDAACTLAIAGFAAAVLDATPASEETAGPAFAVAFATVARAAIVPSRGRWSFAIGVVACLVVTFGYVRRGPDAEPGADFVFIWTFAFALASAGVSRVIYGLHEQVREARQLGQYELVEQIGEGAMGAVYRAHHGMLRRDTALKLLLPERTGAESLARFEREVRHTARLSHPNTVTIFDYGRTPDGTFYYAMELLDGANLDEIVTVGGPLAPARVVHILSRVGGALAEAHGIGLIHRDIKPANIILCQQGGASDVPKVVDFGLVKEVDDDRSVLKTATNALVGTPLYMSPESIRSPSSIDARSDLYALGGVAYYLLTGRHVFQAETIVAVCHMHLDAAPIPPSELGVAIPEPLEHLVLDCLAKDPQARPQSAIDLQDRLRTVDVPPWTEGDARAWWTTHGATLRSRRTAGRPVSATGRTLAVDPRRASP